MNKLQVPTYRINEMVKKNRDYCVAIFVINEGEKLHKQLHRMQTASNFADIIIADGGSTDGSTEISRLKNFNVNTLLTKTDSGQLGAQMRMAFDWALKRKYKGIIVVDGNNKDSVDTSIPLFIEKLEIGYDHVQGSRFINGGQHSNTPLSRLIGLKLIHAPLMRLYSGYPYTDTTNGFRAYSRSFLSSKKISVFRDIFTGYELHYYLAAAAHRCHFRVTEVPVSRSYPKGERTPTKISPIRGNLNVLIKLFATVTGRYQP